MVPVSQKDKARAVLLDNEDACYNFQTDKCEKDCCFLTTACVEHAGLDDDCFELRTLRSFRDTVLVEMPGGRKDIPRYYDEAPVLVRRLKASPRRDLELSRLYICFILPSVLLARLGLNRWAYRTYRAMMRDLATRFPA